MPFRHSTNQPLTTESRFSREHDLGSRVHTPAGHGDPARHRDAGTSHGFHDDVPNPFALVMQAHGPTAKTRFVRAIKTMGVTLVITAVLLGGVFFGKQLMLARLVAGFEELDSANKQTRLIQIASFGGDAVPPLVSKLIDPEDAVSETAFTLLQQMQNDWITLPPEKAALLHARLVESIEQTYPSGPSDDDSNPKQLARARELVRQTILEFSSVDASRRQNDAVQTTLRVANRLLAELNVSVPGSAKLVGSGVKLELASSGTANGSGDGSATGARSGWTDWPPPPRSISAQIVGSGPRESTASLTVDPNADAEPGLKTLPRGASVPLASISTGDSQGNFEPGPVVAARRPVGRVIETTAHLADSPLTALDDETVIRHLANPDALLAGRARAELITRGFSQVQLETATAIAVAGPEDRIRLVDHLIHASGFDSGPWLSMMLDDPDRRVRLHVASAFTMTQDPAVLARLRQRLARETDAHVAVRLRRILGLD